MENTLTFGRISKTPFDIMGVGPMESNAKGDALIENGNTGYRPAEQLLGRGQRSVRGAAELPEVLGARSNQPCSRLLIRGNTRRLGTDHDRRRGRNDLVSEDRSKEIATPPEVATYKHSTKPLPSASRGFGVPKN